MNSFFIRSAIFVTCCGCMTATNAEEKALKPKQTIPLPGVEGRIDHFAIDASGERLFVCALGNNTVEVLDLRKGERIHSITGLGAPQGIAYIPELNRIFVANDKGGICRIYNGKSFEPVGQLDFKDDADNIRYDSTTKQIYVGFGSGGIAVVNAPDAKQIGSIKLSAHPEAFELEKTGKRIFVNVPNSRHVAVIDRDKSEVVAMWKQTWPSQIFQWHSMKRITACLSDAACHRSLSSSTQIRATWLRRSRSPAIRTMFFMTVSVTVFTRSAAGARST